MVRTKAFIHECIKCHILYGKQYFLISFSGCNHDQYRENRTDVRFFEIKLTCFRLRHNWQDNFLNCHLISDPNYLTHLAPNLWRILPTPHSMYLKGKSWAWNVNPATLKIPHSNTWIWVWSSKCGVLSNRHKFRASPKLQMDTQHSMLRITPFKWCVRYVSEIHTDEFPSRKNRSICI